MLKTPVVLAIFNRPRETARVFEQIAAARPPALFVVADSARPGQPGEAEQVAQTRAVVEKIGWPCELVRIYSEANLGNRVSLASGYSRVFEQVEEAIILEDDCLPHPTFFPFCQQMLEHYRHDSRVMTISGCNFHFGRRMNPNSYFFSLHPHLWGFATWRRTWKLYDPDIKAWPELKKTSWLLDIHEDAWAASWWADVFDRIYDGSLQLWDAQYAFACWANSGLSAESSVNLISNIGFGQTASGTKDESNPTNSLPTVAMEFPLKHPPLLLRDFEADRWMFQHIFEPVRPRKRSLLERAKGRVSRMRGPLRLVTGNRDREAAR